MCWNRRTPAPLLIFLQLFSIFFLCTSFIVHTVSFTYINFYSITHVSLKTIKKSYTFSSYKLQSYFEFKFTFLSLLDSEWREYKKKTNLCFQLIKFTNTLCSTCGGEAEFMCAVHGCRFESSRGVNKVGMSEIEHDPIIKMKMSGTCALGII